MAPTAKSSVESNIVGVGIDEKHVDGIPTGIHSVTFLVKSKQPKTSLSKREMLPATTVSGIPTDVEEVGAILPLAKKKATALADGDAQSEDTNSASPTRLVDRISRSQRSVCDGRNVRSLGEGFQRHALRPQQQPCASQ